MGTALATLQKAIYGLLTGDSVLMTQVTGVFDEVPENQPYPYIQIGDASESPRDVFAKKGRVEMITIAIYSRVQGFSQALTIADRIDILLNRTTYPLVGYISIYSMYKSLATTRMSDGLTRKVDLKYDVFAEEV